MKVVIIDNYDSFTYNLSHLVKELGAEVTVLRNDKFQLSELQQFDKIILSPGPGIPCEAGLLLDVIKTYAGKKPILGVCLGHQAIGEFFGEDIRVSQLSDICPFAEKKGGDGPLPASTLLDRKVFRKISGEKVMIQKFLIWKTNKEQSGKFPSYVFYYTDYSSGRKEFLKRDLRVSSSERQIRSIMDEFIGSNIKKGWQEAI